MLLELLQTAAVSCGNTVDINTTPTGCSRPNAGLITAGNYLLILAAIFLLASRWHLSNKREVKHGPAPRKAKTLAGIAIASTTAALVIGIAIILTGDLSFTSLSWIVISGSVALVATALYLWANIKEVTMNAVAQQLEPGVGNFLARQPQLAVRIDLATKLGNIGRVGCIIGLALMIAGWFL